jgi:hypothetical protein
MCEEKGGRKRETGLPSHEDSLGKKAGNVTMENVK